MSPLIASLLLASAVTAKVLPRDTDARRTSKRPSPSILPISTDLPSISTFTDLPTSPIDTSGTLFIGIPSPADYTTTTIPACTQADGEVIDSLVVIGVPTGTFSPGITKTVVVPPQADPTTVTYTDYPPSNATEVVVIEPLPGNCGAFFGPSTSEEVSGTASSTGAAEPSSTADVCPKKGCSGAILRAADTIINTINELTQVSMNLQTAAKKIGASPFGETNNKNGLSTSPSPSTGEIGAEGALFPRSPILDVSLGLGRITITIQNALPTFITFPPFPPSCSSDTIVLAWLEFIRVHQELLSILIGRSGLLETGPIKRESNLDSVADAVGSGEGQVVSLEERDAQGFIGRPLAIALRALEGVVDTLAVGITDLVPGKSECSKAKSAELKASIRKAQVSYEG